MTQSKKIYYIVYKSRGLEFQSSTFTLSECRKIARAHVNNGCESATIRKCFDSSFSEVVTKK